MVRGFALATLLLALFASIVSSQLSSECTYETAEVRKEWGDLQPAERVDYIDAVLCMQSLPSIWNLPGTKSHFDDFVAVHINLTLNIHINGVFLHWHREFVHIWQTALKSECGYAGYQPYWDWTRWPELAKSPLFDGSETSLGGDGVFIPNRPPYIVNILFPFPVGTGGGCVASGPFINQSIHLGPFPELDTTAGLPANWADDTGPRCLLRDLNDYVINKFNNKNNVDTLLALPDIASFSAYFDGSGPILGPHHAGHLAGGPGLLDVFASPADPAFMLHHGMIDKVWSTWQDADPAARLYAYYGTSTIFNAPTTPLVYNDTKIYFGVLGDTLEVKETVNRMGGRYCYRYE